MTTRERLDLPAAGWIALLYLAIYLLPLGVRPLTSPDEVRYGAVARELIESGDWIAPHFNGVRYFEKPILGYWLNAASIAVLGDNPFALRLPTALAAGLTALIVFGLTARYASTGAAYLAAGIYLSTLLVSGVGTTATFDTFLTLFLTAALAGYFCALNAVRTRERAAWLVGTGICCGAAFLTKGFLAFAVPALVAAAFLIARRNWQALATSGWIPIAVACITVAPWALAIHHSEPDFWRYFFVDQHLRRFVGDDAQRAQPFWFFFASAPLIGLPWIWALPAAVQGLRREPGRTGALLIYLSCWIVLPWLFFSVSRGKLLTYVLPCFPPLAIVLAIGLERYGRLATRRAWRLGMTAVAAIAVLALLALAATQTGVVGEAPYADRELAALLVTASALAGAAAAAIFAILSTRWRAGLVAMSLTGLGLVAPLELSLPASVLDELAPEALLRQPLLADPQTVVVTDADTFGSAAWYAKRSDIYVLSPGEIAYGLGYADSRARNLQNGGLVPLIRAFGGEREIVVICRADHEASVRPLLPATTLRTAAGGLVMWRIPKRAGAAGNG